MATRGCKNSPVTFCYMCGYYIEKKQVLHKIVKGAKLWIAYRLYFGMPMGDQDEAYELRQKKITYKPFYV